MKYFLSMLMMVLFITPHTFGEITTVTTTGSGNWSSTTPDAPWPGGVLPTAADNVVIASGHTVTIDVTTAECNDLTVTGTLRFPIDGTAGGIVINGNVIVDGSSGKFRCETRSPAGAANSFVAHTATIKGNITVNTSGGVIDFRAGSNSGGTGNGCNLTLSGTGTTTISLQSSVYGSTLEEFNGITVNKTGGAKIILSSGNLFMSNNSTVGATVLTMTSGNIETGSHIWTNLSTSSGGVSGASSSSYVIGSLGRGMSTSAATTRKFEIGTSTGYRPINIHSTGLLASGSFIVVAMKEANANTGSSTFAGGIDKVSSVRYYQVDSYVGTTMAAASVSADIFAPSYLDNDGVTASNTDLRVAYSTDSRATWNGMAQSSAHTTSPTTTPTTITPDALGSPVSLSTSVYVSLGNATGGGNPLPVELTRFTARRVNGTVLLEWSTATEVNNAGFEVEKQVNGLWSSIGFVAGNGTTNAPKSYRYTDATTKGTAAYRLKQIDRDGASVYSNSVEVSGSVVPSVLEIVGNYPNPFNPSTSIRFTVPADGHAVVKVYNVIGREVATVFNGPAIAGVQNTAEFSAVTLSTGIYFSRLEFNGKSVIGKMILMK